MLLDAFRNDKILLCWVNSAFLIVWPNSIRYIVFGCTIFWYSPQSFAVIVGVSCITYIWWHNVWMSILLVRIMWELYSLSCFLLYHNIVICFGLCILFDTLERMREKETQQNGSLGFCYGARYLINNEPNYLLDISHSNALRYWSQHFE